MIFLTQTHLFSNNFLCVWCFPDEFIVSESVWDIEQYNLNWCINSC